MSLQYRALLSWPAAGWDDQGIEKKFLLLHRRSPHCEVLEQMLHELLHYEIGKCSMHRDVAPATLQIGSVTLSHGSWA